MGGKRPDQYNIDPREGGATDYKNLPQNGHGGSLDDTVELDRQRVARSEADQEERAVFNPGKPAPSVHARAGHRVDADADVTEQGREREARGNTDPRDEGVGA